MSLRMPKISREHLRIMFLLWKEANGGTSNLFFYFACSPEKICEYFFRVCLGIWHWKWRGFLVNFSWSPFPRKQSTKTPRKIRGKFGGKFGRKSGTKIRKIRETFVLQLSDLTPNLFWIAWKLRNGKRLSKVHASFMRDLQNPLPIQAAPWKIGSFPSVSSLSDYSIWRSWIGYFGLAIIAFGAFGFKFPKYYYRLGQMDKRSLDSLIQRGYGLQGSDALFCVFV